ncbi:MAG: biotin/lipoyl-containing protein [Vicinamibacterales bacterium]
MTFEIEIDGQVRRVTVETAGETGPDGGAFRVRVDDEPVTVAARRTDLGLALVFGDGRSVDAALTPRGAGGWFVQLPHVGLDAEVDGRRLAQGRPGEVAATGAQRIAAPMPGRIVRVLVQPGEAVAARQGLIVIEAMKMENELSSPRAGTVREVAVSEGESVEGGRLLVVVE